MIINNEIFINTNNLLRKTWGVTEKDKKNMVLKLNMLFKG